MRQVAILMVAVACAALAAPVLAATSAPPLRYAVETPPGDSAAAAAPANAARPVADPRLRYSVESDGPSAAPTTPVETYPPPADGQGASAAPAPYTVQKSAPAIRGQEGVVESRPVYSAGDPTPPPAAPPPAPPLRLATAEPETVTVHGRGYILGPGDKVHVIVFGEPDLTGDFQISMAGRVAFPLIGEVAAAGATAPQLANRLAAGLGRGYLINPRVAVEVATYRPFFVTGQVTKPGDYPYASGMTIARAIATAGGFTAQAVESDVLIRHEGETEQHEYPVDSAIEIEPGDVVHVEQSTFWEVLSAFTPLAVIAGVIRSGVP